MAITGLGAGLDAGEEPFMAAPEVIRQPGDKYKIPARKFQGIPSLDRAPNGRLWATWYASKGGGEDKFNYVVLATSEDDGQSWQDPLLVVPLPWC